MNNEIKIKKKKPILRFIALLLAVLLPLPLLVTAVVFTPSIYSETFLGALAHKLDRLKNTEGERIIVVGGSSVAFGLDSELLSKMTGYEVVNFGLYATLGTRIMLDLSKDEIREGDIVVLAPELDPQTLSMYFNGEAVWQAADSDLSILSRVHPDNFLDMAASSFGYISQVLMRTLTGAGKLSPEGIYRSDSFNEYGDIVYPREYNVMTAGYDVNQKVSLTPDIYEDKFIEYLNGYIADAEKKGAQVFYTFCPVNRSALAEGTTDKSIEEFYKFVLESIKCPVISDPNELLMHEDYFYDTNFHLNDAGVTVRTAMLIGDINRVLGRTERVDIELPSPPNRPQTEAPDEWVENEWSDVFLYEDFGGGLKIVGVREDARNKTELTLPYKAKGKPVYVIAKGAFADCKNLRELTLYGNISLAEDGAFSGATALEKIHIYHEDPDGFEVGDELFSGAPEALRLHFYTQTSYDSFTAGYWWGKFSARMVNSSQ